MARYRRLVVAFLLLVGNNKDDVGGLSQKIERLMTDERLRNKLARAGLKTAKDYTWEVIAKRLDEYYKKLASQPKSKYIKNIVGK